MGPLKSENCSVLGILGAHWLANVIPMFLYRPRRLPRAPSRNCFQNCATYTLCWYVTPVCNVLKAPIQIRSPWKEGSGLSHRTLGGKWTASEWRMYDAAFCGVSLRYYKHLPSQPRAHFPPKQNARSSAPFAVCRPSFRERDSLAKSQRSPSANQAQPSQRRNWAQRLESLWVEDEQIDGAAEHCHACYEQACCEGIFRSNSAGKEEDARMYELGSRQYGSTAEKSGREEEESIRGMQ